jgi:hypothetical protein
VCEAKEGSKGTEYEGRGRKGPVFSLFGPGFVVGMLVGRARSGVNVTRVKANLESKFTFACLMLTCSVMTMDCFIPHFPEDKEAMPHSGHGTKRPACSIMGAHVYFQMPNILVLLDSPSSCQVAIEYMMPADLGLLTD